MREELYADCRDELKWTIATSLAQERGHGIRWVAMFRPDINRHGKGEGFVPNASDAVRQFFRQERICLQNGARRHLERVGVLCQQLGLSIDMNLSPYPASVNRRSDYIDDELTFLTNRSDRRRDVVLVDPDNGIGTTKSNGMQFHEEHVPVLWHGLRSGDALAVVQFQYHEANWVLQRGRNLARLLDIPEGDITRHSWNNVCIYTAIR